MLPFGNIKPFGTEEHIFPISTYQQTSFFFINKIYSSDQPLSNYKTQQVKSSSKLTTQNNNNINHNSLQSSLNPFASMWNSDTNQLSSIIQTYLTKFQSDAINPLLYLQLMNTNPMFMQQLSSIQNNNNFSPHYDSNKNHHHHHQQIPISNIDLSTETINSGRNSQILQIDSNIFVPKTRPMTQDEIAEHARLVYQKALQRNQLQQHNDLMKHFYETLNIKQYNSLNTINDTIKTTNHNDVPSVPNVSNISKIYNHLHTTLHE